MNEVILRDAVKRVAASAGVAPTEVRISYQQTFLAWLWEVRIGSKALGRSRELTQACDEAIDAFRSDP